MKYWVVAFYAFLSGFAFSESGDSGSTYYSDLAKGEYNRIILPSPFKNLVVSKGAQIDKPIKLNSGRLVLIRPLKSALKQFTITFVLSNDESFEVLFNPVSQDRPVVWRYKDASDVQEHIGPTLNDKHLWLATIFPEVHSIYYELNEDKLDSPRGFTTIDPPKKMVASIKTKSGVVSRLELIPMKAWRGMGHLMTAYLLKTESASAFEIEPSDFWYQGVVAVSTEFDLVSNKKSPYVFILAKDS